MAVSVAATPSPCAQGGLGIGLTLARKLVSLHHGTITAASDGPGKGSTFTVRLPVASGDAPARYRAMPSPAVPATGLRVLVIDDNVDLAETMTLFVRCQGHDVRLGGDGLEAVRIADQFRPDVILLDIGLPGLSGYEVARTIRLQAWAREICLTAVSGWSQETIARARATPHSIIISSSRSIPTCSLASSRPPPRARWSRASAAVRPLHTTGNRTAATRPPGRGRAFGRRQSSCTTHPGVKS